MFDFDIRVPNACLIGSINGIYQIVVHLQPYIIHHKYIILISETVSNTQQGCGFIVMCIRYLTTANQIKTNSLNSVLIKSSINLIHRLSCQSRKRQTQSTLVHWLLFSIGEVFTFTNLLYHILFNVLLIYQIYDRM